LRDPSLVEFLTTILGWGWRFAGTTHFNASFNITGSTSAATVILTGLFNNILNGSENYGMVFV